MHTGSTAKRVRTSTQGQGSGEAVLRCRTGEESGAGRGRGRGEVRRDDWAITQLGTHWLNPGFTNVSYWVRTDSTDRPRSTMSRRMRRTRHVSSSSTVNTVRSHSLLQRETTGGDGGGTGTRE